MTNDRGDEKNINQDERNDQAGSIKSQQAEHNIQATQSATGSFGQPSSNVDLPMPSQDTSQGGNVQTPVGGTIRDAGVYNTESGEAAMGSQTKPADRGQTEGSPKVPPVQPTSGSVQTPVGSSTPDAGVYSNESGKASMGSQTKPAHRGQTEGKPHTSH